MRSILGHFGILLSSIDPDAQEIIDRITITPPIETITRYNVLVLGLKRSGYWDRFDSLYVSKQAADQQAALLDWRRPVSGSINGSASWSSSDGFVGSSVAGSYVNTNYTPSTDASNYAANNGGIGCYLTAMPTSSGDLWGAGAVASNETTRIAVSNVSTFTNAAINGSPGNNDFLTLTGGKTMGVGLIQHNRVNSGLQKLYKDGDEIGTKSYSSASRSVPSVPLWLLAWNNTTGGTSHCNVKIGAWWAGSVFTSVEQAEIKSLFDTFFIP